MARKFITLWNGTLCQSCRENGRWLVGGDVNYKGEILMIIPRDGELYWCKLVGGSRLVTVDNVSRHDYESLKRKLAVKYDYDDADLKAFC